MPTICEFMGIRILMHFDDHPPPHFHAEYAEHEAVIDIRTFAVRGGSLPPRQLGLVVEWAASRQRELLETWDVIRARGKFTRIQPLD